MKAKKSEKSMQWKKSGRIKKGLKSAEVGSVTENLAPFNIATLTPLQIFRKYFDDEMYSYILELTENALIRKMILLFVCTPKISTEK